MTGKEIPFEKSKTKVITGVTPTSRISEYKQSGNQISRRRYKGNNMIRKCLFNLTNVLKIKKCNVQMEKLDKDVVRELKVRKTVRVSDMVNARSDIKDDNRGIFTDSQASKSCRPTRIAKNTRSKDMDIGYDSDHFNIHEDSGSDYGKWRLYLIPN